MLPQLLGHPVNRNTKPQHPVFLCIPILQTSTWRVNRSCVAYVVCFKFENVRDLFVLVPNGYFERKYNNLCFYLQRDFCEMYAGLGVVEM